MFGNVWKILEGCFHPFITFGAFRKFPLSFRSFHSGLKKCQPTFLNAGYIYKKLSDLSDDLTRHGTKKQLKRQVTYEDGGMWLTNLQMSNEFFHFAND